MWSFPAIAQPPLGDAAATSDAGGRLAGTATYDGPVPSDGADSFADIEMTPECAAMYLGPVPSDTLMLGYGNTLGNVFVRVLNPPPGDYELPTRPVVIDQDGCVFSPHVVGVRAGQPLGFRKSDRIRHNVHGLPRANREFNLGMPPTVPTADITLSQPEPLFRVQCDVHPWMSSYVAVMSHPYFAVSGPDGRFTIVGMPDGAYEIEAWHETLPAQRGTATVRNGEASVDLRFPASGR